MSKFESGRARPLAGLTPDTGLIPHPFDLRYGVRTSGLVAGRNLKSGHEHDRHVTAYYGVAPSVFRALLSRWRRLPGTPSLRDVTFLDVGAGMGRAMLLAAQRPFRSVHGIELNPTLARIARSNLRQSKALGRARSPLRLTEGDATRMKFPPGPCVAFLFNPFGRPVMKRFLAHIARCFAARPGELDLLYVNDEQAQVIRIEPGMRRLWRGRVERSLPDRAADKRILLRQPGAEYRADSYEDCSIFRWTGRP